MGLSMSILHILSNAVLVVFSRLVWYTIEKSGVWFMRVGFLGAGRMCTSFCKYLHSCKVEVSGVLSKKDLYQTENQMRADVLAPFLKNCDIVFLTVRDDGINQVAREIAASGADVSGCVFCHMSGSLSSDELLPLQAARGIFSFHTMTSLTGGYVDFSKVLCTLQGEGDSEIVAEFAKAAGLTYRAIKKEDKLLYHAASCICANYFVTLASAAKEMYNSIGFSDSDAYALILPLVEQVLANLRSNGVEHALTGPISRSDTATLAKHVADLDQRGCEYAALYRFMGRQTAEFAETHKIIQPAVKQEIDRILK